MRLLLLSNSRNFGGEFLAHAEGAIKAFLGRDIEPVLFVPYAAVRVSYDDYAASVAKRFGELGYGVQSVHTEGDAPAAVARAQAIVVGGGNTFRLLERLCHAGLMDAIRSRVLSGAPYVGWSAGANLAGLSIRTTNDMPIVQPPTFDALGLAPFQINPHYTDEVIPHHAGESREERILEFVTVNSRVPVVGLREGGILRVEGSALDLLGDKSARVFVSGREPEEYAPGSSLQYLMK